MFVCLFVCLFVVVVVQLCWRAHIYGLRPNGHGLFFYFRFLLFFLFLLFLLFMFMFMLFTFMLFLLMLILLLFMLLYCGSGVAVVVQTDYFFRIIVFDWNSRW